MFSLLVMNLPFYWLFGLALGLAFAQAFSPDRWIPFSLIAWKNNYPSSKIFKEVLKLTLFHMSSSIVLYFIFSRFFRVGFDFITSYGLFQSVMAGFLKHEFILIILGLVSGSILVFRLFNYRRASIVLSLPPESRYAKNQLYYLIGPSEVLVLLLFQFEHAGYGLLTPTLGYALGTFIVLLLLNKVAIKAWDQPQVFSHAKQALRLKGMFFSSFLSLITAYFLIS